MAADKSSLCSLCEEIDSDSNLSECEEKKSWITLLDAAKIRKHERILSVPVEENGCLNIPVRYHRTCQSTFTYEKDLLNYPEMMRKRIPVQANQEEAQGILMLENLLSFPNIVYSAKTINTSRSQQQGKNSQPHGIQGGGKGKEECNG